MSRTANDWGNLVLAELKRHESPGTVARLLGEITGHKPTLAPALAKAESPDFKAAAEVIKHIGTDKALEARLATLKLEVERIQKASAELERREKLFEQYRLVKTAKLEKAKAVNTENMGKEREATRQEIEAQKADWKGKLKEFLDAGLGR